MEVAVVIPVTGAAIAVDNVVRSAYQSRHVASVTVVAHESARHPEASRAPENESNTEGESRDDVVAGVVRRAALAGASVTYSRDAGRGGLILHAINSLDSEALLFLDADLRGLLTHHVDLLTWPLINGRASMASGLIDSGTLLNQVFMHLLPVLTRQRAVKRELLGMLEPDSVRRGNFESDLEHIARRTGASTHAAVLEGVWQSPHFSANSRFGPAVGAVGRVFQYLAHPIGLKLPALGPTEPLGGPGTSAGREAESA